MRIAFESPYGCGGMERSDPKSNRRLAETVKSYGELRLIAVPHRLGRGDDGCHGTRERSKHRIPRLEPFRAHSQLGWPRQRSASGRGGGGGGGCSNHRVPSLAVWVLSSSLVSIKILLTCFVPLPWRTRPVLAKESDTSRHISHRCLHLQLLSGQLLCIGNCMPWSDGIERTTSRRRRRRRR